MDLLRLPGRFAVCRLAPNAALPDWARGGFISITRTPEELSLLCEEANLPQSETEFKAERGWAGLKVKGPLEFTEIGILAALAAPLAQRRISIFVVSTFDTDYLFVKEVQLLEAVAALKEAGHSISGGENG